MAARASSNAILLKWFPKLYSKHDGTFQRESNDNANSFESKAAPFLQPHKSSHNTKRGIASPWHVLPGDPALWRLATMTLTFELVHHPCQNQCHQDAKEILCATSIRAKSAKIVCLRVGFVLFPGGSFRFL